MKRYVFRVSAVFPSIIEADSEQEARDLAIENADLSCGDEWYSELESVEDCDENID